MSTQLNQLTIASLCMLVSYSSFTKSAFAKVDNLLSGQSFTGALLTPNAQVVDHGDFSFLYGQGVPFQNHIAELDNLFFAAGFAPGFEAGGRIVTQSYNDNCFTEGCGIRDLSASLKYQLPFVYDLTGINLAVGGQDIGGAANNFAAYYAVADYEFEHLPVRFSAGYGQSDLAMGIMDGPFGSIEVQPLSFVQLVGEYDAAQVNAAVKLFTPEDFLPYGAQIALQYQIYSEQESTQSNKTDQNIWGMNASLPFLNYNFTKADAYGKKSTLTLKDRIHIEQSKSESASLKQLERALIDEGFINVKVGHKGSAVVVALENRRYNHNQIDGMGVALGIISSHLGDDIYNDLNITTKSDQFELLALANNLPMIQVSGSATCYRHFVKSGDTCTDLIFATTQLSEKMKEVEWLDDVKESGFGRTQVILAPALRHRDATEYGVFDYSLALATNVYTTLWSGAAIDIRHLMPVSNSDDFEEGGYWEDSDFENEVDRILMHQTIRLPFDVTTQFSAGMIYGDYQGVMNETQWTSPSGMHTLGFQISQFSHKDEFSDTGLAIPDRDTGLYSYTLSVPDWNWQGSVEGGNFWNGDSGYKITSTHWLGDAKLEAQYQSSTAQESNESEQFLLLAVSVPLTLWRDMKPGYLQLRGTDQFTYAVQTRIRESHNNVNSGLGASVHLQHSLSRQYYNNARMSPDYFDANVYRLRNAYLKYLEL